MTRLKHIIFLIVLSGFNLILGQDPYHQIFDVNDGLPSSEIYDSELDSLGRIWLTTDRGISVYDGYDFKNYTTEDGLVTNTNFEIFKGKGGRLYFIGENGMITIHENDKFYPFSGNKHLLSLNKRMWINYLYEDTDSSFIFKYSRVTYTISEIENFKNTENIYRYSYPRDTIEIYNFNPTIDSKRFQIQQINDIFIARDKTTQLLVHTIKKIRAALLLSIISMLTKSKKHYQ